MERLKEDLAKARDDLNRLRANLTAGRLEEEAKKAGTTTHKFTLDRLDDVQGTLGAIHEKVKGGAYKVADTSEETLESIVEPLGMAHESIRELRRDITGGYVEDKTKMVLEKTGDTMDDLVDRLRKK